MGVIYLNEKEDLKKKEYAHLSIESYHRINRIQNIAHWLHIETNRAGFNNECPIYISEVFSYIRDDVSFVLKEIKDMGICDKFIKVQQEEKIL